MGYRNATITVDLSDLAEGCFVTLKNPALQPQDWDAPDIRGTDGRIDNVLVRDASERRFLRLIVSWRLLDPEVDGEDVWLPQPTPENQALRKVPSVVWDRIREALQAAEDEAKPTKSTPTPGAPSPPSGTSTPSSSP